ncbi:hypothetical protein [Solibacillus sp. FSL K6-1523]|uniref:hypothetical protein n=1 Tax=Solibacillus sp. FSL K6-1523 TaxID=2921471 RepID=UPI0030F88FBC
MPFCRKQVAISFAPSHCLKAWQDGLLDPLNDILARWLLLLGMVDALKEKVYVDIYKELEELVMKDENLQEALTVWENMS